MVDREFTPTEFMAQLLSRYPEYEIDKVLANAKSNALRERERAEEAPDRKDALEMLRDFGCDNAVLSSLGRQSDGAHSYYSRLTMHSNSRTLLKLPVIPRGLYGLYGLVSFVRNNGRNGRLDLNVDPNSITDSESVPKLPYYCLDVDLGEETQGMNPTKALAHIQKRSRLPLTVDELLALCTHSNVLLKRPVCALGSNVSGQIIPCMIIHANEIELILIDKEYIEGGCGLPIGMPSCAQRYHDPSQGWLVYNNR